ncbi:MAG: thrombospondin type 3 repeat-containing protein [Candidatus Hydrogenedentota bacterium]
MKRFCSILLLILCISCVEEETIKKEEIGLERFVSYLVDNYKNRNAEGFLKVVSRDFCGGFNEFEKDIRVDLGRVDQIEIVYNIDSVEYSGNETRLELRWRKKYLERTDRDFDGMPDLWERYNGLDENDPADAYKDTDGDGFTSREEFLSNSDPLDPTSVPAGTVNTIPSPVKREFAGTSFLILIKEDNEYQLIAQEGDVLFGNSDKLEEGF